jgi:hypothetical protein
MGFVEAIQRIGCNPVDEGAQCQHLHCREGVDRTKCRMEVQTVEVHQCTVQQHSADHQFGQDDPSPIPAQQGCVGRVEVEVEDNEVHGAPLVVNLVVMQEVVVHPLHWVRRCWAVRHGG